MSVDENRFPCLLCDLILTGVVFDEHVLSDNNGWFAALWLVTGTSLDQKQSSP